MIDAIKVFKAFRKDCSCHDDLTENCEHKRRTQNVCEFEQCQKIKESSDPDRVNCGLFKGNSFINIPECMNNVTAQYRWELVKVKD